MQVDILDMQQDLRLAQPLQWSKGQFQTEQKWTHGEIMNLIQLVILCSPFCPPDGDTVPYIFLYGESLTNYLLDCTKTIMKVTELLCTFFGSAKTKHFVRLLCLPNISQPQNPQTWYCKGCTYRRWICLEYYWFGKRSHWDLQVFEYLAFFPPHL